MIAPAVITTMGIGWKEVFIKETYICTSVSSKCQICQYKNDNKDGLNCHIKREHIGLRNDCHS